MSHQNTTAESGDQGKEPKRLYSCVAFLTAEAPAALPATQGHHAHAAFLDLVNRVDPALAKWLHDAPGRKPFTVSPLRGLPAPRAGLIEVPAGWRCWLRFTFLAQPVFATFLAALLHGADALRLQLGSGSFLVTEVRCTPGSHPWAGWTTAETLAAQMRGGPARTAGPSSSFSFELATPTAWSLGGDRGRRIEVLPTPALFFGSLLSTWNAWFGDALGRIGPELRDYLAEAVVVSYMHLETRMFRYRDHLQVGTVGRVTYRLLGPPDTAEARILAALADFAFYAGVGYRTTMGMGQVRLLPDGSKTGRRLPANENAEP